MAMENPKSPMDPTNLIKLMGVSLMSWISAWSTCSLVVFVIFRVWLIRGECWYYYFMTASFELVVFAIDDVVSCC
jgi:hypothetical protein